MGLRERYEYYLETLSHCGSFLKGCDEEEIAWALLEEFDGDSVSFLHKNALASLLENGWIDAEVYEKSLLLREEFRKMENTRFWNPESVKDGSWDEILSLADEIKEKIGFFRPKIDFTAKK